ncbi:MAG: hypothetical protein V4864_15675 [Pseudomonadota bacterium]
MSKNDRTSGMGDPEQRRPPKRSTPRSRQGGYVNRATASGRSGYGVESVRPYLRAQLKLKDMMRAPFVEPAAEQDKPDGTNCD